MAACLCAARIRHAPAALSLRDTRRPPLRRAPICDTARTCTTPSDGVESRGRPQPRSPTTTASPGHCPPAFPSSPIPTPPHTSRRPRTPRRCSRPSRSRRCRFRRRKLPRCTPHSRSTADPRSPKGRCGCRRSRSCSFPQCTPQPCGTANPRSLPCRPRCRPRRCRRFPFGRPRRPHTADRGSRPCRRRCRRSSCCSSREGTHACWRNWPPRSPSNR